MKYIIEFEDEPCMREDGLNFYKCIQAPWYQLSGSVIKRLTPYEPEQKNGRWVAVGECYVKCSECGLETTKNELRGIALFGKNEPYFCPNCGADMRGGGE